MDFSLWWQNDHDLLFYRLCRLIDQAALRGSAGGILYVCERHVLAGSKGGSKNTE
jgi:hypothetical protein